MSATNQKVKLDILNYIFDYYYKYEFPNEKIVANDGFGNEWIDYKANYMSITDSDTLLVHVYKIINSLIDKHGPKPRRSVIEFIFDFAKRQISVGQNILEIKSVVESLEVKQEELVRKSAMIFLPSALLLALSLGGTSDKQKEHIKLRFQNAAEKDGFLINTAKERGYGFIHPNTFESPRFSFLATIEVEDANRLKQIWDSLVLNYVQIADDIQGICNNNPGLSIVFSCINEHTPMIKTFNQFKFPIEN